MISSLRIPVDQPRPGLDTTAATAIGWPKLSVRVHLASWTDPGFSPSQLPPDSVRVV